MRTWTILLALGTASAAAGQSGKPARPVPPSPPSPPVVIRAADVPLYDVYAWERWGNFINALAGSKTEIPYDAARLQVKVYTYPSGEIRAIRFGNGVRTHRHINQTDTILYSWQASRVQYVNALATVAIPGDFALHQKGVDHSGEEIRRGGGIDLEFAMTIPGRHNDPTGFWSLAREHPVEAAAQWRDGDRYVEAVGAGAATAPAGAVRYRVRLAALPGYPARELHLTKGTVLPSRDPERDRLMFVAGGRVRVTVGGRSHDLAVEDTARAPARTDFRMEALEDSLVIQASVPPAPSAR
jgi:mannose-6-phosphate isomerase-like protein (cupin superfamily)